MTLETILEMKNITKSFRNVRVLDDVSLSVQKGTVHVLMGENGAGKSTLMKILMGIYAKDSGNVVFNGNVVEFKNTHEAMENGIAMIHQELSYVDELSVCENIFLGREYYKPGGVVLDFKRMKDEAKKVLESVGLHIPATTPMRNLTIAQAQMVEIAKALSREASLIVMDEPTSAITDSEVKILFNLIKDYVEAGNSVLYITHKMEEVFKIADEITVLRDGCYEGTYGKDEIDANTLIKLMVNREIEDVYPAKDPAIGEVVMKVDKLASADDAIKDVSFDLRKGEILGFAGLLGSGRTETAETIFGIRKASTGRIEIGGKSINIKSPRDAIKAGIGMVTEDRKESGLVLSMPISDNIILVRLKELCRLGFFRNGRVEKEKAEKESEAMNIKMRDLAQMAMDLSGGNQQKVVLAKWLIETPGILILDEPTRGIDVGAKSEIYKLIVRIAESGKSIIMISSELPEIIGLSDRVVIFGGGTTKGVLERNEVTQETIMSLAMDVA